MIRSLATFAFGPAAGAQKRIAWEERLPAPRWYERNEIPLANRLFAERVLHEKAQ